MIDLLYLCHGRLEFTKASLPALMENTNWDEVGEFVIYNDAAPDHPETFDYLHSLKLDWNATVRDTNLGSPVAVMNHFRARSKADIFAKIDNDVIVCPGWLPSMLSVMEMNPEVELLGMQPGMSEPFPELGAGRVQIGTHGWTRTDHIGGVGLMRVSAFNRRPAPLPNGRFGFTEWQHTYNPVAGWISPDLPVFCLDFLPIEPWASLTEDYIKAKINRRWPKYVPEMSHYWEWWQP